MKTRVIFLDDHPGLAGRLQTMLEERGYTCVHPKTLEEAVREINLHGAELIVHCAHTSETHWKLCEGIFSLYPHFPSLHLATGPVSAEKHICPRGPFHQIVRHLAPEKEFLRRVRKMIFLGRLNNENRALKKAMALMNRADKIFDTLDSQALKKRTVEFFAAEFRSENVLWISPGAYNHFLHDLWRVVPLKDEAEDSRHKKYPIVSWETASEETLSQLFREVSAALPSGWEFRASNFYVPQSHGRNYSVCFVPIMSPESKRILGHVVMVNPLLWGDLGLDRSLPGVSRLLGRHLDHAESYGQVKNMSYVDDLTDLYNQRYLRMVLDKEIYRAHRNQTPFSVLFMDIDHFKRVNDTSGHIVGSKVLIELSKIVRNSIRAVDYAFRYGGDEFICVLAGSNSAQAAQVAERIRKQVESSVFDIDGVQIKVTLSVGLASCPEHAKTKEEIISMADRALYCGKSTSRNVVYVAS